MYTAPNSYESHQPAVVIDRAAKTYTVGTASTGKQSRSLGQRLRGVTGVYQQQVVALKLLARVVETGEADGMIGMYGSGISTHMILLKGYLLLSSGSICATSTLIMLVVHSALVKTISGHDNSTLGCLAMAMTS